ncbi:restriction endonuclease [Micromonospora echinaurantiaca]|uniref:restriction endonuclease n=1 Tax=Micromonospora echinaurantiaca TaxID=47857 RepID=UPI00379BA914
MTSGNTHKASPTTPPQPRPLRSWQDAEHNAAAWMRYWGYRDAVAQPGGADGGVDVRAGRALAQVKYQAAQVGRPELQRLFGARGRAADKQLIFFTGSGYAGTAVAYADEHDIALFVYELDGRMTAVNATARRVARPPAEGPERSSAAAPERNQPATTGGAELLPAPPQRQPPQQRRPAVRLLLLLLLCFFGFNTIRAGVDAAHGEDMALPFAFITFGLGTAYAVSSPPKTPAGSVAPSSAPATRGTGTED